VKGANSGGSGGLRLAQCGLWRLMTCVAEQQRGGTRMRVRESGIVVRKSVARVIVHHFSVQTRGRGLRRGHFWQRACVASASAPTSVGACVRGSYSACWAKLGGVALLCARSEAFLRAEESMTMSK
jgi:hypothetical protein